MQAETFKSGTGQDDGVVFAGRAFGQTGIDVAAQIAHLQIRTQLFQLHLPALRGGADHGTDRQFRQGREMFRNEGIEGIVAGQHGGQRELRLQLHRHILQRMHGGIGAAFQHGHFQLFQEQTLAADFRQRHIENLVTARGHRHQFHLQSGMGGTQQGGDMVGLPERERAFTGGQSERFHRVIIALPAGPRINGP